MIYEHTDGDYRYLLNDSYVSDFEVDRWVSAFEPEYLKSQNRVSRVAKGRGITYFFSSGTTSFVLKHYYRGGLVRRISQDLYLWQGSDRSRAEQEIRLLDKLHQLDLPVPQPVASRVRRRGRFYQADLITTELVGAQSLSGVLYKQSMETTDWRKIGALIRRFHEHNVFHADLNAHNIMVNERGLFLIDFDNGSIRAGNSWKSSNLRRLERSLSKLKSLNSELNHDQACWDQLVRGYKE